MSHYVPGSSHRVKQGEQEQEQTPEQRKKGLQSVKEEKPELKISTK